MLSETAFKISKFGKILTFNLFLLIFPSEKVNLFNCNGTRQWYMLSPRRGSSFKNLAKASELNEKTDHHRDGLKESTAEEAKTEDDTAHDDAPYLEDLRKYSPTGEDAGRLNDNYKTDNLSTYDDETDDIIDDETRRVRCVPRRAAALDSDVRRKLISETFE